MYRPPEFHVADLEVAAAHVRRFPFGMLVSAGRDGLRATHLPFLLGADRRDGFARTLASHGSALNPHLQALADDEEVLVVVPGPDAYVSGSWYRAAPDVPTWNYTAVHISGRYRRVPPAGVLPLLHDAVRRFEADRGEPGWCTDVLDDELVHGLARGVIAFEVEVHEVRGVAKLSQDKPLDDVARVRGQLQARSGAAASVAAEMTRLGAEENRTRMITESEDA